MSGGVGVIRIGAATETEMKESKYRVEDALNATKAAVEEGIIAGGGSAYIHAQKAVLAEADSFETIDALPSDDDINASSDIDFSKDKVNEVAIGKKGSETAGYVVTVTDSDGYGGDIKFTVGISTDGKVLGVSFLSISETAGLGMRAKQDPSFTSQFTAKSDAVASFSVVTDGSASESNANVDAIGGSTITSKSVTKGVNYALAVYKLVAGN